MTTAAGIGGLVGGLSGLFGANASNIQPPASVVPLMNQIGAANTAFSDMGSFQNIFGNLGASALPAATSLFSNINSTLGSIPGQAQSIYGSLINNPFAASGGQGVLQASGLGENAALQGYNLGGQVAGAGQALLPYAQSIMNTAFDPQQALYNQTLAQTQQQAAGALMQSGTGMSPYASSVMGNTLGNFNINWQNNELQRQAMGASAAGGLVGAGTGAMNLGAGMMNAAPGQFATAATMPYNYYNTVFQNQQQDLSNLLSQYSGTASAEDSALSSMLSQYGQAAGIDNMSIANYLAYIGAGNASNATANQQFQTLLSQNQLANNQNLAFGNSIGSALATLGKSTNATSPLLGGASSFLPGSSFLSSGPVGSFG